MSRMVAMIPQSLGLIAGKGSYPLLLAESARRQGVKRIFAIAFKGETDKKISSLADEIAWITVGQLAAMLKALENSGVRHAVMAGQITPTRLFRVRMDSAMIKLLKSLPEKNAETIFGAAARELKKIGIEMMPASAFMEHHMPGPGVITERTPTKEEEQDIALGMKAAKMTSGLDIGQMVAVKNGTILAVEAFEGTDETIKRAGRLGGKGFVVVKVAKKGHDMRFDIPVIGPRTVQTLRKAHAGVLAVESGRAILLDKEETILKANGCGLCIVSVEDKD